MPSASRRPSTSLARSGEFLLGLVRSVCGWEAAMTVLEAALLVGAGTFAAVILALALEAWKRGSRPSV